MHASVCPSPCLLHFKAMLMASELHRKLPHRESRLMLISIGIIPNSVLGAAEA